MKRMYDERVAKLIEKVHQEGNTTEVGGNLEIDGKTKMNGGFEVLEEYATPNRDEVVQILTRNIDRGLCLYNGTLGVYYIFDNEISIVSFGDDNYIYYSTVTIKNNVIQNVDSQYIEINDNYQTKLFRHTVEIKGTNISLCFTTETTSNTPIDSLQDLILKLASTKLSCSGYIESNIVSKIDIGATATAISFVTSGGNKTIASLGTITMEDDVTTL